MIWRKSRRVEPPPPPAPTIRPFWQYPDLLPMSQCNEVVRLAEQKVDPRPGWRP